MKRTEIKTLLADPRIGEEVLVKGWVRAFRANRFIALNDGSSFNNIQVVVDFENLSDEILKKISFHACLAIKGQLVESQGAGQAVEINATSVEILGESNAEMYALQPKRQTMEFLREKAHFRMRTNTFSAVFRIRHAIAYAVHKFYHDKGYYYMHTPIITGSDAEGAGEMFRVSTFEPNAAPVDEAGGIDYKQDFFGK
ncbi:MAG: OB-fold nucleic acid binding domain-containing protein, partial [Bacteroidota bacterium]